MRPINKAVIVGGCGSDEVAYIFYHKTNFVPAFFLLPDCESCHHKTMHTSSPATGVTSCRGSLRGLSGTTDRPMRALFPHFCPPLHEFLHPLFLLCIQVELSTSSLDLYNVSLPCFLYPASVPHPGQLQIFIEDIGMYILTLHTHVCQIHHLLMHVTISTFFSASAAACLPLISAYQS